jgi:(p)ppGpp synthase/HD superfamily hydrolase
MIYTPLIQHALDVAAFAHKDQRRKSLAEPKLPYIVHPVGVLLILQHNLPDVDEPLACAALLHDILEDVPPAVYSKTDMLRDFGETVVEIVGHVSEPKVAGEPRRPWRERKEIYLTHLKSLPDTPVSRSSLRIAMADKIHNLRSVALDKLIYGGHVWEAFNASPADEKWYYDACYDALHVHCERGILRTTQDYDLLYALSDAIHAVFGA